MGFEKLEAFLNGLPEASVPGCDLVVYRDHAPIYRHFVGHSDAEGKTPMDGHETYCFYSCSKVYTTCAAMQLIGEGKLALDAPVADYLPAYGNLTVRDGDTTRPARTTLTIRHLMSMQSGMDYDLHSPAITEALAAHPEGATTRQLVDAMAKNPLWFDPGERYQYCLGHDVLAAVIEVVSGKKFSEYLQERIFKPLGGRGLTFDFTPEVRRHLCAEYVYNADEKKLTLQPPATLIYKLSPAYESGGAGLIGTMMEYALLPDALACGGVSRTGERILSQDMIRLWTTDQLTPEVRKVYDFRHAGYSYALGVRVRVDKSMGGRSPLGEFGWDGAAGAWTLIDPIHHLSIVYAQHIRGFGYAYDVIHPTVLNLTYEALGL